MISSTVEMVPAILRKTYEDIASDWNTIVHLPDHIQIDITDGIFAGDRGFLDIKELKKLPESQKLELHMMVHTPGHFLDAIVDVAPARCIFHIESFSGTRDIRFLYETLRDKTQTELALAINPSTPIEYISEHLDLLQFVLFMGYNPGWANQPLDPTIYSKIATFRAKHSAMNIAIDGHVGKDTVEPMVKAGARILCANTSIFGQGNPQENYKQLQLLAEAGL